MSNPSTGSALLIGEDLLQRGEYDKAIALFESLLQTQPDDVELLVNLGVAALSGGDVERGVEAHLQALRVDPTNEPLLENLALLAQEPAIAAHFKRQTADLRESMFPGQPPGGFVEVLEAILKTVESGSAAPNDGASSATAIRPSKPSAASESPQHAPEARLGDDKPASEGSHARGGHPTSPSSEANYRVDRSLGIVLKNDEAVRDYVSLPHHLGRTDLSISAEDLLDYLQFTFQKLIGTYFNTTRLPESYVHTAGSILERLARDYGRSLQISPKTEAEFVYGVYHFLNEHLAPSQNHLEISIPSTDATLQRPEAGDDVRSLYRALKTSFQPLEDSGLISLFVVHGSYSTLDFTPFSDVDTQLFLTNLAFDSPEMIAEVATLVARNNHYLKTFDPLQHHGYFVATEADRRSYPEPFLPIDALRKSTRIFGDERQRFAVNHVPYADRFAAWHMGHFFRLSYLSNRFPQNPYATKQYLSRFALLPVLYLELVDNVYPYKGDVFRNWEEHFTPQEWAPFHTVTRARANWNPQRGARFGASFHRGVFEFAELLLDKLNGQFQ